MMDEDFDIREERFSQGEKDFENALRPLSFSDFSGQKKVVENLEVFVEAAKYRGEPKPPSIVASRSTTPCCTVLQDWARPHFRISLPTSWA